MSRAGANGACAHKQWEYVPEIPQSAAANIGIYIRRRGNGRAHRAADAAERTLNCERSSCHDTHGRRSRGLRPATFRRAAWFRPRRFIGLACLRYAVLYDRYGGMFTIALAYCATANNSAIRRLLHVAVSDVSDDVRRAAVGIPVSPCALKPLSA